MDGLFWPVVISFLPLVNQRYSFVLGSEDMRDRFKGPIARVIARDQF
jgi:hypothetical protein